MSETDDLLLAERWLANQRRLRTVSPSFVRRFEAPPDFDWNAYDSVLDLLLDETETRRAWGLANCLLDLAADDADLTTVAVYAIEPLLRKQGDQLLDELAGRLKRDDRLRRALRQIYLHGQVAALADQLGVTPDQ